VTRKYDVVVIGGGIHGVGVAQATAADGYSVLLLEQSGLASGTSSKSSKLIHGGLRYLETGQLSLVRESLRERELLLRLAPDLVQRRAFFIPIYPNTSRRPWLLRTGLALYSLLAGMRKTVRFRSVPRREWSSLDGLLTDRLQHVFQYWDAQADDAALTRSVMKSAETLGAELACPAEFVAATIDDDGCEVDYRVGSAEHRVRCLALVNAAGPWACRVADRIIPPPPTAVVDLVQGTHLELPGIIARGCYYVESQLDQRAVFVMPWQDHTLLGTTEVPYTGNPSLVHPLDLEIRYLLDVYSHYFPNRPTEILKCWSGLRVLPAAEGSAFKRSRETQLPADNEGRPRVVSIFGGKLTGYRATSHKVMIKLHRTLPLKKPRADTREIRLSPA
jgi:glycerol-3-phosphate dehydrogenase